MSSAAKLLLSFLAGAVLLIALSFVTMADALGQATNEVREYRGYIRVCADEGQGPQCGTWISRETFLTEERCLAAMRDAAQEAAREIRAAEPRLPIAVAYICRSEIVRGAYEVSR